MHSPCRAPPTTASMSHERAPGGAAGHHADHHAAAVAARLAPAPPAPPMSAAEREAERKVQEARKAMIKVVNWQVGCRGGLRRRQGQRRQSHARSRSVACARLECNILHAWSACAGPPLNTSLPPTPRSSTTTSTGSWSRSWTPCASCRRCAGLGCGSLSVRVAFRMSVLLCRRCRRLRTCLNESCGVAWRYRCRSAKMCATTRTSRSLERWASPCAVQLLLPRWRPTLALPTRHTFCIRAPPLPQIRITNATFSRHVRDAPGGEEFMHSAGWTVRVRAA